MNDFIMDEDEASPSVRSEENSSRAKQEVEWVDGEPKGGGNLATAGSHCSV